MMRMPASILSVAIVLAASAGATLAQDESPGPDIESQRVDSPQGGVAMSVPTDWGAVRVLDEFELTLPTEADETVEVDVWRVMRTWSEEDFCDLFRFAEVPLTLDEHAAWFESTESAEGQAATAETEPIPLPVGEGIRVIEEYASYDSHPSYFVTSYFIDIDSARLGELVRYGLTCGGPGLPDDAWLSVAETVEPLGPLELDFFTADLERYELPVAGMAMSFPAEWTVGMRDMELDPAEQRSSHMSILWADDYEGLLCSLLREPSPEGSLEQQAEAYMTSAPDVVTASATPVRLPVGDAYRIDLLGTDLQHVTIYLFDEGRFSLVCRSPGPLRNGWLDVAETIELIAGADQAGHDSADGVGLDRVEMPGAAIAMSLPSDWYIERLADRASDRSQPDESTVRKTTILAAYPEVGPACWVDVYEGDLIPLREHIEAFERLNREWPEFDGVIDHVFVDLPVGLAIRLDTDDEGEGFWETSYYFDLGEARYRLDCFDDDRAPDDHLALALSIEALAPPPAEVPIEAVSVAEVGQFAREVPVSGEQGTGGLMIASCSRALWIELPDGTAEEHTDCHLDYDLLEPPEVLEELPLEASGGPCEWASDYWYQHDGSLYLAHEWSMSINHIGDVRAVSRYGAEPPDCPEG